ncbi:MAG: flavodoxin [Bacteroidales bacterium]|nr:flavodoxin [Bacteroidales bacterium]MBR0304455.1 flavodoxin [Bacteroidales bacterium]
MNIKNILVAVLVVVFATGCNGQNKNNVETFQETSLQNEQTSNSGNMSKSIVIFFSHAGDNYSVGVIDTGNTKIVADYISEITGADQFEIVTHKYDGMAYTPLIELAKKEAAAGELPPYEGAAPDLSGYDTVFIGGPVWWGTYPQVMFTLFKDINLDGKTVIPFTTHEGSGLASCASDVRKAFPKAKVTGEFSIYGHEVRGGKAKVEKWLKSL